MSVPSPTIEGFRAAFRRPSLTLAEVAWRWSVGSTTLASAFFYFIEYLSTLPVTGADSFLLSSRQPAFIARALAHILHGSLNRAVLAALLLVLALCVLWIIAASIGRLSTLRALFERLRSEAESNSLIKTRGSGRARPLRALIDLNFLRVAMVLAVFLAVGGAAILCTFVSSDAHPRPALAFALFIPLAGVICTAGWALNWWLSFAGIFAVRNEEDALGALSAAVSFFRERTGAVCAVSTWTGFAHLIAFSIATTVASVPFAFIPIVPFRLVIAPVMLVTLAYFAVVDWLYVARLAGYICIAEMPGALLAAPPIEPISPSGIVPRIDDAIDRDERILSDIPNLALET